MFSITLFSIFYYSMLKFSYDIVKFITMELHELATYEFLFHLAKISILMRRLANLISITQISIFVKN